MFSIPLDVSLCKTKIKDEYFVRSFVQTNAEVIRFNISVDEMPVVHILNSCDHLVDKHEHGLQREFPEGLVEQ